MESTQVDNQQESLPDVETRFEPEVLPDVPEELKDIVLKRQNEIVDLRRRNADLLSKLNDREIVVQKLTQRLEQAAEQLDRLRRTGADRGGKLLSGIPAEVIDEQRELINDLKEAIRGWEELQSTSAMGRFEEHLRELREMLHQQLHPEEKKKASPAKHDGSKTQSFILGDEQKSAASKPTSAGKNSTWEQMKAAMLGNAPPAESEAMIPGAEVGESDERGEETPAVPMASQVREIKVELKERPAEIDLQGSDRNTLIAAIKARDEHIDHLMEVIEDLKHEAGQVDLDELKRQKEEAAEKLRKAEIEMSMERAKLAREAARLKQYESDLTNPKGNARKSNSESADEKGNRWKRFLGSK